MKFLLEAMLKRKEVTAADVLSRANFVITGMLFRLNLPFFLVVESKQVFRKKISKTLRNVPHLQNVSKASKILDIF